MLTHLNQIPATIKKKETQKNAQLSGKATDNIDMNKNSILITEQIKDAINDFLGTELIPACAVGNELTYQDGSIVVKTFKDGNFEGHRKLDDTGELINIITEF